MAKTQAFGFGGRFTRILTLAFAALLLAVPLARGADIVNNLSAASSFGYDLFTSGDGQAQSFQNGPQFMAFTNIALVLINNPGQSSSTVTVQLRANNGGLPGAVIETVTNLSFVNSFPTTYSIPAKGTNILAANTTYWIALIWVSGDASWRFTTSTTSTGSGIMLDADAATFDGGGLWSAGNANEVFKMAVGGVQAPITRFVSLSGSHTAPFATWATAATTIQAAVDAAIVGDTVLVTNGIYQTGGRVLPGCALTNRLVLDKPIPVRSVNGPAVTIIKGAIDPISGLGSAAIRCAYVTNGASLSGFTLADGATLNLGNGMDISGGGVWAETGGVLSNCILTGNMASVSGGGTYGGVLNNCRLTGNTTSGSSGGGGASAAVLNNCTLTGNTAYGVGSGGGAFFSTLNNCTLTGNSAVNGGGAYFSALNNCIVYFNSAFVDGANYKISGFTYSCTTPLPAGAGNISSDPQFANLAVTNLRLRATSPCLNDGNNANAPGGADLDGNARIAMGTVDMGAYEMQECSGRLAALDSIAGFQGFDGAGGMSYTLNGNATLQPSAIRLTPAAGNQQGSVVFAPLSPAPVSAFTASFQFRIGPDGGDGDIDGADGMSFSLLDAGVYGTNTLFGEEGPGGSSLTVGFNTSGFLGNSCTILYNGSVIVEDLASFLLENALTNRADVTFAGNALTLVLTPNGGPPVTVFDAVSIPGFVPKVFRPAFGARTAGPYNEHVVDNFLFADTSHSGDLNGNGIADGCDGFIITWPNTRHVSLTGSHTYPFTNWLTAATNIQAAVDAAFIGDTVLVTNGIYQTGGRVVPGYALINRVVIDKPIPVRSVNGPAVTIIKGAGPAGNTAIRCAYVTNGASLSGFTLTNGATRLPVIGADDEGGGVWSETGGMLSNCTITGNSAVDGGGGTYQGTLNNCTLSGNSAGSSGGGAYQGTLNNCTLSGNSASVGGGAFVSTLNNCTLTGNSAGPNGGGAVLSSLNNCIVYFNTAGSGANHFGSTFTYSCTTPLPGGTGNIASDPQFENLAEGNLRLRATSPCRDTGNNTWATGTDLDGNPRIVNTTVDMGAYEFSDADGDGLPGWWETGNGLNPAASNSAAANSDADGYTDWQEYIADTNPTNPASYFPRVGLTNAPVGFMSLVISNTSAGRVYGVFTTTNLVQTPQTWTLVPPEQTGTTASLTLTITNSAPAGYFRTGVRLPWSDLWAVPIQTLWAQ